MILVSRNIRYMQIFAGVPRGAASNSIVITKDNKCSCLHPLLWTWTYVYYLFISIHGAINKNWRCHAYYSYLSHHIRPREPARHLCSSTAPLLYKPFTRTHFADRAFRCAAPSVWNSLATDITSSCSLTVFKSKLKTHIFRQTFNHSNYSLSASATEVFLAHTGTIQIRLLLLLLPRDAL